MTLLDAKEYHPEKERKKRTRIISIIVLILVLAFVGWWNRFWPEKRVADRFFSALQKQDFESAYGIYYRTPTGSTIPRITHSILSTNSSRLGSRRAMGIVKSYRIYGESNCPGGGSGVVIDVVVNDRTQHAQLYVDKSDKTISSPPCDLEFH